METSESLISTLQHHWQGGGLWMYPIAIALVFAIAITIDRTIALFFKYKTDKEAFVAQMTKHVLAGDLAGAVKFVSSQPPTPLTSIVKAGLLQVHAPDEVVQSAIDEASLREMPKIEKRTGYLAMIGNIGMLLGLLGTISGLITCFSAVSKPGVDPSLKSMVLANGISEAMNCTAFGLLTAIPALVAFAVLNGRTQAMVDEINETAVALLNLIVNNRDKLKA
jgi:biopolymer transport protein ExbB